MIDIHSHILYNVDDGSESEEMSRSMLDDMASQGVKTLIATPHFRRHMFSHPKERIEEAYETLKPYAAERGIELLMGCEYHVDHNIYENLETGAVHTLGDSGSFVLTEYSHSDPLGRILEYTQELVMRGYRPVIAHIERYEVFQRSPKMAADVIDAGAWVQVNANSVLGLDGRGFKKVARKLLDMDLVHCIGSDAHNLTDRKSHMAECFALVQKKYGQARAERLFERNPGEIRP